eukprot:scaffold304519_cov39-Attheya_sp.AAC.1
MSNHAVCTVDIMLSKGETLNINRCPVVTAAKTFWNRFREHSCHYLTRIVTFNVVHPILIIDATN